MSYLESLSLNLQKYTEIIVKELRFQSYHFIELFIYFNNFIEDEFIEQESFVTANTTLLNPEEEDEDGVESLSKDIFEQFSTNDKASITALSCYLKKISISTSCEFDVDVLLALLDKDNKGYIDYTDIEIIISSLEDFIEEKEDWSSYEAELSNKKIIKKNLLQNKLFDKIKKLFKTANQLILNRIDKAKKIEEENQLAQVTINKKDKDKEDNATSGVTIYKRTKLEKKIDNQTQDNQSVSNKTQTTNQIIPLDEMLFDRNKLHLIQKIRKSTYLYDINYNDILNELSIYESQSFSKQKFIIIMCKIISKLTSDLLITPIMKMALSMFFHMIDSDKKNEISFYEALGAILPLTKDTNHNDKIKMIFKYPRPLMYQLLSGTLSLYLNTKMIKDLEIFSEIVFQNWDESNVRTENDLLNWALNLSTANKENTIEYKPNFPLHSPTSNEISHLINSIKEKYTFIRSQLMNELSQLSILNMTNRIIKYSFLGVINNYQLNTLLKIAIEEKYQDIPQKTKENIKDNCLNIIEQQFDFTHNELIDITHLQGFCMLIFSGSTLEKFQSIFAIFDLGDNDPIEYDDLCEYLTYLFGFVIKQTKIEWCDSKTLARIICNYIVDKVDKKITLTCLMQVYEMLTKLNKTY